MGVKGTGRRLECLWGVMGSYGRVLMNAAVWGGAGGVGVEGAVIASGVWWSGD